MFDHFVRLALKGLIANIVYKRRIVSWALNAHQAFDNMFMGTFEEKYIYTLINNLKLFCIRFIDDMFLLWKSPLEELLKFKEHINTVHPTIKFDFRYSSKSTNFLDSFVTKPLPGNFESHMI